MTAPELVTPTGVIVTDADPETPEWFAARRGGITGTDLPKILGITKYGNALSVWLDKRGELDDSAGEAARWGQLLEDPVALEWAHRHRVMVAPVGVIRHVDEQWIRASLDRVVHRCPDDRNRPASSCGLEVKTRSAFKAADWRDGVPDDVLAQTTWGLVATGFDHMHVAALIGGQQLRSFRVDRDEVLAGYLLEQARPVWAAVEDGTPPSAAPDAEGVLLDLLDRLYQKREGDRELDPGETGEWLALYADGHELETRGKRLKTQAKTALVQLLDDGDTGLIHGAPAFTYKAPDPGFTVTAADLRALQKDDPTEFSALVERGLITPTSPGPRFDVKKPPKETS